VQPTHEFWLQGLHEGWQQVLHEFWQQGLHGFWPATIPQAEGTRRGCGGVAGVQSHTSGLRIGSAAVAGGAVTLFLSLLSCGSTTGVFAWTVGVAGGDWYRPGAGTMAEGADSELGLGSAAGVAAAWGA
jgi:hypothetical protein